MAKFSKELSNPKATNISGLTVDQFESLAGDGMQNATASDFLIPRLTILQSLSPQLVKTKPEYIKTAKAGDICDTATRDCWEAISVVPVYFVLSYIEWAPRASGRGLIAVHENKNCLAHCTKNEKGVHITPSGNTIVESAQFYVLNLSAGGRRSFIAMSSTQRKKAKLWMTFFGNERVTNSTGKSFMPPIYYRTYNLSVGEEANAQGSWLGWRIEHGPALLELPAGRDLLAECLSFKEVILSGQAKVRDDQLSEAETHPDSEVM